MSAPWTELLGTEDLQAYAGLGALESREPRPITFPGLLIVDMTEAFVDSRYSTGIGSPAEKAVAATANLLEAARASGHPVWFTVGYHAELPAAEKNRWRSRNNSGRIDPPASSNRVVTSLRPNTTEQVVDKMGRASGFFGTPLMSHISAAGVDGLVISGLSTSGCVRATVVDAFQFNLDVVVPFTAVADRSPLAHAVSLLDMHSRYADVTDEGWAHAVLSQSAKTKFMSSDSRSARAS
jgi:maleamate amidohydrolase